MARTKLLSAMVLLAAMAIVAMTSDATAQKQGKQPPMPDPYAMNMMIRSTIIALNQANQTGNYTVLRDLASPSFRRANNPSRLAEIFAKLRKRNLDLTPIIFFQPKLLRQPAIDKNGYLTLIGFFPSKPERVNFQMLFQKVNGQWLLYGLAVNTSKAAPATAQSGQNKKPAEKSGKSAKAKKK